MVETIFENDEIEISMGTQEDIASIGIAFVESALAQGVEYYENNEISFDEFKSVVTASLSPSRFKILKIACEELTSIKKEYYMVMKFIEALEEIAQNKLEEIEMEE